MPNLRAPQGLRFGVFELDVRSRELRRNGLKIHLQDKPFELLLALAERPNTIVTRDELRQRLWPADTHVVFGANVNTAVRKVRDALGDDADTPRFVETIPRRGYRFLATVVPAGTDAPDASTAREARPIRLHRHAVVMVAVATMAGIGLVLLTQLRRALEPARGEAMAFRIAPPEGTRFPNNGTAPLATVSPDGQRVVFLAQSTGDGVPHVWLQGLGSPHAIRLPDTEHAWGPFWSPDGTKIGVFSSERIQILDLDARGEPRDLTDAPVDHGASWGRSGDVLVAVAAGHLERVPWTGGQRTVVTTVNRSVGERRHMWPHFLPDGRTFIYLAQHESPGESVIMMGSLDSRQPIPLVTSRAGALFDPAGSLLYLNADGTLLAQRLDVTLRRVHGKPVIVATGVDWNPSNGRARFSVSTNGVLVYSGHIQTQIIQPLWLDRSNARLGNIGGPAPYMRFELAPDGRTLAAERRADTSDAEPDIWLIDLQSQQPRRVIDGPAAEDATVWAPDSRRFAYARHEARMEPAQLLEHELDSRRVDQVLTQRPGSKHPTDWAADDRSLLFTTPGRNADLDIWTLRLADRIAAPLVDTPADEQQARFSADGRWVTYTSNKSGRYEIYAVAVDSRGEHLQLSRDGGAQPHWREDGAEVIFVSADLQVMSVAVSRTAGQLQAALPQRILDLRWTAAEKHMVMPFTMTRDAQRFIVGEVVREHVSAPVTVMMNWRSALR